MLGKLMKYEFKSTARIFLPFYASVIVLSILNRVLFVMLENVNFLAIPRSITMATYVLFIIATFVMTLIVVIQRFYKSLLSEEGYLSMTLPVKTSSHILSKGITAFVWVISTVLTTLISIIIVLPNYEFVKKITPFWQKIRTEFEKLNSGISFNVMIILCCAFVLVGVMTAILMIYTSIAFGQLSNKHKVLTSFGAYIAIYAIVQTINIITITIIGSSYNIFSTTEFPPNLGPIFIISELCIQIALCIAYFLITTKLLDKKLNLQ